MGGGVCLRDGSRTEAHATMAMTSHCRLEIQQQALPCPACIPDMHTTCQSLMQPAVRDTKSDPACAQPQQKGKGKGKGQSQGKGQGNGKKPSRTQAGR